MIIVALFTVLMAARAADADVRLQLDESAVLPGTPTGFTIVVTNPGLKPLQLPSSLWLVAINEDVTSFRVSAYGASDNAAIGLSADQRTVPPGESREFRFDPSPVLAGSPWFTDGRLSEPGHYRLRAVFAPSVETNGDFRAADALASNEEMLTVAVDSPEDAAVWEWMRTRGGGKWGQGEWMSQPFADFVMKNHPKSGYALYAAIFQPRDVSSHNPALAEQAARFPNKSYTDQLKLVMVQYHQQAADVLRHSDLRAAAAEADAARELASELAARSRSSFVRTEAKRLLAETPKRELLVQQPQ
jgi:hypothetical protein